MDVLFKAFVVLFIVIDPIGVAAIFAAMTHNVSPAVQRKTAILGTSIASGILITFFLIGDWLLQVLGIGIPAFRIAGGILLFLLAIDMVVARQSGLRTATDREQHEATQRTDLSVFPLAFPLIAGPGAMTTVLLMASSAETALTSTGLLSILVLVMSIMLVALLFAPKLMQLLGETGANVISRMLGLILASLAVQYVLDGIKTSLNL
ncbi:MAG: MarC family protein [Gammaproteobacteria bacterium]|nr:MarC family protein [Gammaproteobacteria bacterium]